VLAAVGIFGGDRQPVQAQGNVKLSFWSEFSGDPDRSTIQKLIDQFQQANPSITIEHRPIENEQFFTVLRTGFTSGNPPDIFQHEGHNNVFQFSDLGEVEAIDDFWTANKARFLPGTEASVFKAGHYYGVPFGIHTDTQIYHNQKLLADHGIDPASLKTWDDYLAAFDTLKSAGITPIAFGNKFGWCGSQWFYGFLVRQVGVDPVLNACARAGGVKWTDPRFVQAAKHYTDINSKGYFSTGKASDDYPVSSALFFAGRAGFFQTGSWFLSDAAAGAPPDFKLGLNTFPMITGGEGTPKQVVMQAINGISISKAGAKDPAKRAAALKFLDFLTQVPQAQVWVKDTNSMSAVAGAVTPETASPLLQQIITEQVEGNTGSFPFLEHILPKEVGEDAIWMGSVGVLTGQLTAESWMASVEAEAAKHPPVYQR
jgi:raffinose/stachyose/melibiose transport system substrate-binding protein